MRVVFAFHGRSSENMPTSFYAIAGIPVRSNGIVRLKAVGCQLLARTILESDGIRARIGCGDGNWGINANTESRLPVPSVGVTTPLTRMVGPPAS